MLRLTQMVSEAKYLRGIRVIDTKRVVHFIALKPLIMKKHFCLVLNSLRQHVFGWFAERLIVYFITSRLRDLLIKHCSYLR